MKRYLLFFLFFPLIIAGCVTTQPKVEKSQLQIREFQTRSYDTPDVKMVMKAVMHTLQDDSYIIKEANVDLGLLTAQKEVDVSNQTEAVLTTIFAGAQARYKKNSIIEASANVSDFGTQTKVRINFQSKVMDNHGGVISVKQVDDMKFYQEFFAKVDKAVFLAKEKL